ncbi:MAG: tetratricopeptide repeat protein [Pseudomonadota bacterium]
MSEFLREVDEDYRRDQLLNVWRKYGWMLLLGAGLIILGVAGYTYYDRAKQEALEEQATQFMVAQRYIIAERDAEGVSELEAMLDGKVSPGYRAIANLTRAQLLEKQGKRSEALAAYEAISKDATIPASMRSLGLLSFIGLNHSNRTASEIETALAPLLDSGEFQYTAEELIAAAYLREGNTEQALPFLRRIRQAEEAPSTLRARAQTLLTTFDDDTLPDVTDAVIETPEAEGETP